MKLQKSQQHMRKYVYNIFYAPIIQLDDWLLAFQDNTESNLLPKRKNKCSKHFHDFLVCSILGFLFIYIVLSIRFPNSPHLQQINDIIDSSIYLPAARISTASLILIICGYYTHLVALERMELSLAPLKREIKQLERDQVEHERIIERRHLYINTQCKGWIININLEWNIWRQSINFFWLAFMPNRHLFKRLWRRDIDMIWKVWGWGWGWSGRWRLSRISWRG